MKYIDKRKNRILPDKVFCTIWMAACAEPNVDLYIHTYCDRNSKDRIDFSKYNIFEADSYDLLTKVHNLANMTINDIINAANIKRTDLQYRFCIPKRTLQDWCYEKNVPAPYIKLMLLREYGLLNLGEKIVIQSDVKIIHTTATSKGSDTYDQPKVRKSPLVQQSSKILTDDNDNDEQDLLFDEFDKYMEQFDKKMEKITSEDYSSVSSILSQTDYLRDIIHRKNNV